MKKDRCLNFKDRSSHRGSTATNPTDVHENVDLIPGLAQWVRSRVALSCAVGHRRGSDLVLLWLWRRPAAVAPIRPLAWESPYAVGAGLKKKKKVSQ